MSLGQRKESSPSTPVTSASPPDEGRPEAKSANTTNTTLRDEDKSLDKALESDELLEQYTQNESASAQKQASPGTDAADASSTGLGDADKATETQRSRKLANAKQRRLGTRNASTRSGNDSNLSPTKSLESGKQRKRSATSLPLSKRQRQLSPESIQSIADDEDHVTDDNLPRPPWSLSAADKSRFSSPRWWNDAIMFSALQFLQTLFDPEDIRLLDPASVSAPGQLPREAGHIQFPLLGVKKLSLSSSAQLLFPLCLKDHWVAVRVRRGRRVVDIFDSKLDNYYYDEACKKLTLFFRDGLGEQDKPVYVHSAPVKQKNNDDCGPIAVMVITYLAFARLIDPNIHVSSSRDMFRCLLCDTSGSPVAKLSMTPSATQPQDLHPKVIASYLRNIADQMEDIGRRVLVEADSLSWASTGLELINLMESAVQNRTTPPDEVGHGLRRAKHYFEQKLEHQPELDKLGKTCRQLRASIVGAQP